MYLATRTRGEIVKTLRKSRKSTQALSDIFTGDPTEPISPGWRENSLSSWPPEDPKPSNTSNPGPLTPTSWKVHAARVPAKKCREVGLEFELYIIWHHPGIQYLDQFLWKFDRGMFHHMKADHCCAARLHKGRPLARVHQDGVAILWQEWIQSGKCRMVYPPFKTVIPGVGTSPDCLQGTLPERSGPSHSSWHSKVLTLQR